MTPFQVSQENAHLVAEWIAKRGGVFVWNSINLSNPSGRWISPAKYEDGKPFGKPNWQCESEPARHITSVDEVEVITVKEIKRFHVAVEQRNLSIKVTDGGSRRIRTEVEKAEAKYGKPASHRFDYGDDKNAVIVIDDIVTPLSSFIKEPEK